MLVCYVSLNAVFFLCLNKKKNVQNLRTLIQTLLVPIFIVTPLIKENFSLDITELWDFF